MVSYNTKEWLGLIFKFHKSDTFRRLFGVMACLAVFSGLVVYIEVDILNMHPKGTTIVHSILGFILSLLLVFRTNTAYDRWWEGRRAWGTLLNNSRNLAIKLNAYLGPEEIKVRQKLARDIHNYARALKDHLRNKRINDLTPEGLHQPNFIAKELFQHLNQLYTDKKISGDQLIVLNGEFQSFTDVCGICERIKKTPIPYSYSLFLKKFIFVYTVSMPFSFVSEFKYTLIPIVVFVFYALASLELIAEEIEDPFGTDANDLPTDSITENIGKSVQEILLSK